MLTIEDIVRAGEPIPKAKVATYVAVWNAFFTATVLFNQLYAVLTC